LLLSRITLHLQLWWIVSEVLSLTSGKEQNTLVRMPFAGDTGSGAYVVLFQADSTTITETRSSLFVTHPDQTVTTMSERNGKEELNATLKQDGTFVKGTFTTSEGKKVPLDNLTDEQALSGE
jgi:hypothetical protein